MIEQSIPWCFKNKFDAGPSGFLQVIKQMNGLLIPNVMSAKSNLYEAVDGDGTRGLNATDSSMIKHSSETRVDFIFLSLLDM